MFLLQVIPTPILVPVIILIVAVIIIAFAIKKMKIKHFKEYYDEILKYVRDETNRWSVNDAEKARYMITILEYKSFCKKTDKMLNELEQLWQSKFAHLSQS